jgi:hypothetical protein
VGIKLRRLFGTSLLCIVLLISSGCGGDDDSTPEPSQAEAQGGEDGGQGTTVPDCPFTEDQVTDIVGQPMTDQQNCLFGDGKGVASLTITMASESTGAATLDTLRESAEGRYDSIEDLGGDGSGYVAVGDLGGEAVSITQAGSFTLTMSSFERLDPTGYEQTLRSLVDAALEGTS